MSSSRRSPAVAMTPIRRPVTGARAPPGDGWVSRSTNSPSASSGRGVVGVVDDHPVAVELEHVEPARRHVVRGREGSQALPDVVQVGPAAHDAAAAARAFWTFILARPSNVAGMRWVQTSDIDLRPWRRTIISPLRPCSRVTARRPRGGLELQALVLGIHAEVDDRSGAVPRHRGHERVVGVEDGHAVAGDRLDHHALHLGQLADRW